MIINDVDQNSDEWLALRAAMPTASEAKRLVTSKGAPSKSMQGYALELAENAYAGRDVHQWVGNNDTQYGHDTEPLAVAAYELQNDIDTDIVGFCTDDNSLYGCSPDRMIAIDGLLEAKCLPKKHMESLFYYKKNGTPMPDKVAQPQMQLLVTERKWCDLFFYSEYLPSLTIRIYPIPAFQEMLKKQIMAVIAERNLCLNEIRSFK